MICFLLLLTYLQLKAILFSFSFHFIAYQSCLILFIFIFSRRVLDWIGWNLSIFLLQIDVGKDLDSREWKQSYLKHLRCS